MTDAQPPTDTASRATTPAPTRIGYDERQQAMDALDVHLSAGRLDPEEYRERVGRASVARTTADLEPLFDDLPAPHADVSATAAGVGSGTATGQLRAATDHLGAGRLVEPAGAALGRSGPAEAQRTGTVGRTPR